MGKAGRKSRKKNRQKRNVDTSMHNAANTATTAVNPQSAVHRLRHADPKVRHGALVALQASVLSQLHCGSHNQHKQNQQQNQHKQKQNPPAISMKVLQAVREQVTSNDLECSAVAADCLAQYLTAISEDTNHHNRNSDEHKQITASWALVLLGRLDDCRTALTEIMEQQQQQQQKNPNAKANNAKKKGTEPQQQQQQHQQQQQQQPPPPSHVSKNQQKKAENTKKQWYAVSAPCFIALCRLIEDNGHAMDRINLQKKTFVEVVLGMLLLECNCKRQETNHNHRPIHPPKPTTRDRDRDRDRAPLDDTDTAMDDTHTDTAMDQDTTTAPHDAIFAELRDITALYAARSLHSALDDNYELAGALDFDGNGNSVGTNGSGIDIDIDHGRGLWRNLLGAAAPAATDAAGVSSSGHFLPTMTRLHLIGCLVNLYQMSGEASNASPSLSLSSSPSSLSLSSSSWQEELILEHGIVRNNSEEGLLPQVLLSHQHRLSAVLAEKAANYRAAQSLLETQQQDQHMEDEVNAQVQERKEPAKLIAKRQKKVKDTKREVVREQQKAKMIADAQVEVEAEMEMDDADMADASEDDHNNSNSNNNNNNTNETNANANANEHKAGNIIQEQDGEEATNEALLEFTSTTGPIQLGLEIFTNLVSTWIGEDDHPMGDSGGGSSGRSGRSSILFRAIQTQTMASKLAATLQTLSQFLRTTCQTTTTATTTAAATPNTPELDPIRNDVEETIGVVSAGVMNCFLSGILNVEGTTSMWNATLDDLRNELGGNDNTANYHRSTAVLDACASILAVAVEMNPGIQHHNSNNNNNNNNLALFQNLLTHLPKADAVCLMSSAVLAEANNTTNSTEDAVRSVTVHFLGFLRIPIETEDTKIQTSVLKAFMDWYGNDGFYPHLYERLNISAVIEGALVYLAANNNNNNNRNDQDDDLDEEQLQILHNSERFVEYKKQFKLQLR